MHRQLGFCLFLAALVVVAVLCISSLVYAQGKTFSTAVKLDTPKRPSKRAEGKLDEVLLKIWLPDEKRPLRGAVFNPFYLKAVEQKHWQAACRHWGFAIVSANYFSVKKTEFAPTLAKALQQFAKQSGHPEIADIPLCPVGMSAGAGMSVNFAAAMPKRIIAAGPVCLEVGPRNEASYTIPMITIFGERDGRQMDKLAQRLPELRGHGAQFAIAVQWRRRHEFARANNLLFALFDRAIRYRHPKVDQQPGQKAALRTIRTEAGWLGDPATWQQPIPTVASYDKYTGDRTKACWFPDAYVAHVWQAFVVKEPQVQIVSPAGMGDGKSFQTYRAGKTIEVTIRVKSKLAVKKLELFDGDRLLSTVKGNQARLESPASGLYALIAAATLADGSRRLSRPNTIVVE